MKHRNFSGWTSLQFWTSEEVFLTRSATIMFPARKIRVKWCQSCFTNAGKCYYCSFSKSLVLKGQSGQSRILIKMWRWSSPPLRQPRKTKCPPLPSPRCGNARPCLIIRPDFFLLYLIPYHDHVTKMFSINWDHQQVFFLNNNSRLKRARDKGMTSLCLCRHDASIDV